MGVDRVFVARLVGLAVFGPDGERIGRVRDLVVALRVDASPPRVLGMLVELATRRRIFVPMLRVTAVDPGAVTLATGSVSLRGFTQRPNETLLVGQLLDARVRLVDGGAEVVVVDAAIEPTRTRDWVVGRLAVRAPAARAVPARPDPDRALARGHRAVAVRPAGHRGPAVGVRHDAPGRRRRGAALAAGEAPVRGDRRAGRRAAGRRVRGDVRRRTPGAAVPPGRRAGGRRAGGDVPGRRRRPARLPAGRRVGGAAGADGARGVGAGAPAAELLGAHRGRADDPGAGHPAPGRHGGRGAGPDPQPGHPARAGQHGVRLPAAVGHPDRALPGLRARPAAAPGGARSSWSPGWWTPTCRGWPRRPRWAR